MHDPRTVHFVEPANEAQNALTNFRIIEVAVTLLDTIEQLSSFQKFKHNVNWVIRLKHSFQLQKILLRFDTQLAHHSELIYQTFFALIGWEAALLGKSLDSKLFVIF